MKALLIDDDKNLTKVLSYQLNKNNFEVVVASDGNEGLKKFNQNEYDVVLTDIQMPGLSGIDVLREIRNKDKNTPVILITAYGSVENAVEACKLGADDYLTKPFSQEQMIFVIEKATRLRKLEKENVDLHTELEDKFQFENMVAKSSKMQDVQKMAARVATSDATVLILGESGTGKEILAKGIHYNSLRKDKAMITVNCPSIPDNLIESELFGHVKGAFTGALNNRIGKFELADGGTIFLDEIAELKEGLQAKLLRVLQEQVIEPLGSSASKKVDVRVIAATNKNLENLVDEGQFRADLYYRLSVIPLVIPPLRERKQEIPYLVDFFVEKYGKGKTYQIEPDFMNTLMHYNWPGNIRELENAVERAVVLSVDKQLTMQDLPAHLLHTHVNVQSIEERLASDEFSLEDIEKTAIIEALRRSGGNQTSAARLLDIPRHVLLYRMKKYRIHS